MHKCFKLLALSATFLLPLYLYAQQGNRPNIIYMMSDYMMSDDHAYQAISAYGHGLNHTPILINWASRACYSRGPWYKFDLWAKQDSDAD